MKEFDDLAAAVTAVCKLLDDEATAADAYDELIDARDQLQEAIAARNKRKRDAIDAKFKAMQAGQAAQK